MKPKKLHRLAVIEDREPVTGVIASLKLVKSTSDVTCEQCVFNKNACLANPDERASGALCEDGHYWSWSH